MTVGTNKLHIRTGSLGYIFLERTAHLKTNEILKLNSLIDDPNFHKAGCVRE